MSISKLVVVEAKTLGELVEAATVVPGDAKITNLEFGQYDAGSGNGQRYIVTLSFELPPES